MYYARSHSKKKVKNVFDLLISLSLIQSIAFPPSTALDRSLKRLLSYPEQGLGVVAFHDQEAAGILHFYLTGYATLRKFYDLRDEESNLKEGEQPRLRPFARKRAAAATLIALISSASDSIYGGLYDESRDPVVHVDGLLALLGEAMVFINRTYSLSVPAPSHVSGALLNEDTDWNIRATANIDPNTESCAVIGNRISRDGHP